MNYVLLSNNDSTKLALTVTKNLKEGWELYGSPMTGIYEGRQIWHYQAMILRTPNAQQPITAITLLKKAKQRIYDCEPDDILVEEIEAYLLQH